LVAATKPDQTEYGARRRQMKSGSIWPRHLERALLILGLILVAVYALAKLHSEISAHLALRKFEAERQESRVRAQESVRQRTGEEVDFSLWSDKRVQGYLESLLSRPEPPAAVLRIQKLHLEVPVYDGTDDLTLNRGVGRIIGTTRLGVTGNTGIAGHRDGFFRGLKDLGPGDTVELLLPTQTSHYVVENIQITNPDDVSVLQPTAEPHLTLVTCYPFYFIGSAPQRYIVSATFTKSDRPESQPPAKVGVQQFTQRRD
jgi:sortase A